LQRIGQISELVADVPAFFSLPRDPDDAIYVDLAAATKAGFIVSRDNDLLELMQNQTFKKAYPNLTVIAPTDFLALVRAEIAKSQAGS
jgi:predicted nucleic acid-binding protein